MGLFKGILKIGLSPLNGVAEIVKDLSGDNGESQQGLSILSCGTSSAIKGTAKGLVDGIDEILN